MKIHYLGTCAGTEPLPGRRHTATILETGGVLYQIDAGDGCAYTASAVMKLDLLKTRALFVTHPHIDHQAGLPYWIFSVCKLHTVRKCSDEKNINIVLPDKTAWDSALALGKDLRYFSGYDGKVSFQVSEVREGTLFEDENVKVEALHNLHLGKPDDGIWRSFSYRIWCEGKKIIFSGDINSLNDLAPFLSDGCDVLHLETGHHNPPVIASQVKEQYSVGTLVFTHNGRHILNEYEKTKAAVSSSFGNNFLIAEDATTAEF